MRRTLLVILALAAASVGPIGAQVVGSNPELPRALFGGIGLHVGLSQGEFADNVNGAFGGNGFVGVRFGDTPIAMRFDLGYSVYGSRTRRVPLGTGPLGLIAVDVTTTNAILDGGIGLQAGRPGAGLQPYLGGSVGFSYFFTETSVAGSQQMNSNTFASSTNYSDGTLAKTMFGGLYIPVGKGGSTLDVGVRYHWNGDTEYLTSQDIKFDAKGDPVLTPRRTRADLLAIRVGLAFGRR